MAEKKIFYKQLD